MDYVTHFFFRVYFIKIAYHRYSEDAFSSGPRLCVVRGQALLCYSYIVEHYVAIKKLASAVADLGGNLSMLLFLQISREGWSKISF